MHAIRIGLCVVLMVLLGTGSVTQEVNNVVIVARGELGSTFFSTPAFKAYTADYFPSFVLSFTHIRVHPSSPVTQIRTHPHARSHTHKPNHTHTGETNTEH